ncbi:hypothetical protein HDK77DRAFT_209123 [Phyllosticta capitalensis]
MNRMRNQMILTFFFFFLLLAASCGTLLAALLLKCCLYVPEKGVSRKKTRNPTCRSTPLDLLYVPLLHLPLHSALHASPPKRLEMLSTRQLQQPPRSTSITRVDFCAPPTASPLPPLSSVIHPATLPPERASLSPSVKVDRRSGRLSALRPLSLPGPARKEKVG